jgi:hypothetical protein
VFLAEYNIAGSLKMLEKGGGAASEFSSEIAIDRSGNILITGHYENGPSSFGNITLPSFTTANLFLAKFDIMNRTWTSAFQIGESTAHTFGNKIVIDSNNNMYLFAQLHGSFELYGSPYVSKGGGDLMIFKFKENSTGFVQIGSVLWGDRGNDKVISVHIDSNDNMYVIARFGSLTQLGSVTGIGNMAFKMNTDFKILWAELSGFVQCITKSNTDNIYLGSGTHGELIRRMVE